MSDFKYDIAISFLADDEQLAVDISERINEKFEVFIYSKRQEKLAGTDGQDYFSKVFNEEARTVMILYRSRWGETPWTRVEETAIKDRWFRNGYEFLLMIPLEDADLPKWFPKTMLYYDYKSFGLDGLPPVIYSHLKRNGATEKKSSLDSIISKIDSDKKFKEDLEGYIRSQKSADDFILEAHKLFQFIRDKVSEINKRYDKINMALKEERERCIICYDGYELNFYHHQAYSNTSEGSNILFRIYKGYHLGYQAPSDKPKQLREEFFELTKDRLGNTVWKSRRVGDTYLSEELIDKKLEELITISK